MEDRARPVDTEEAWAAVLKRDRRRDGAFVYAVASTGVYCRPSCPSRRPFRRQVTFFGTSRLAEAAGFRACRRCRPDSADGSETQKRIERARQYLNRHSEERVTLARLAAEIGMSPSHLQRVFKQVVGLSPKEYRDLRRMEHFKTSLKRGETVTKATYEAGFNSSSRLYARVNSHLGMTPSVFRSGGSGATIRFATAPTVVGRMLVAVTERGIAALHFGNSDASLTASLKREFPRATLRRDPSGLKRYVGGILQGLTGKGKGGRLPLDLHATAFQQRVREALQRIPYGSTRSYRDIARVIGQAKAARAVGRACATNSIAIAIPCHRVIREDGRLGGYRWGLRRKARLLALEQQPACSPPGNARQESTSGGRQ